jgi:unsaturated chondroitin disaccharide hydrolase
MIPISLDPSLKTRVEHVFEIAAQKLHRLVETHPDAFPIYTRDGYWNLGGEAWTNWCEGFLGGQLWLLYQHNGESYWREKAEHYSRLIEPRKTDRAVHDLGFLFWSTYKRWFDLTDDPSLKDVLIQAGKTMGLRYRSQGSYLRSFLAEDSLFIDIMMNVGIIFYAAQQSGDEILAEIAKRHCLTTRKYLVRGDGSTAHEGIFDLQSGEFLRQSTQQGWRGDSSWARGLAWALYGFSTVYQFTGDIRFLETAELCARFYMQHTPDHGVPPNDWDEPEPILPYESSAAAITASGLLNLAQLTSDPNRSQDYHFYALRILTTLTGSDFLADQDESWEGLLKHGMYHQRKGLGVDESVMWGDYFFLEACWKVLHGS